MTPPRALVLSLAAALALLFCSAGASAQVDPLKRIRNALESGQYDLAKKELDDLKPTADQKAKALYYRTRLQLWTGQYGEAVKTARQAARLGPASKLQITPWLAEALVRQGKADEAIKELQKVVGEKEDYRVRMVLGELLDRRGERSEARAVLMPIFDAYNADEIKDDDAVSMSIVGRAAAILRNTQSSNKAFNLAEQAGASKRVETLLWRAELYLDKYDPGHAAEVVKEALKISPNDPRVRVAMAHVQLSQAMDFAAAEEEIDKALAVDPKLASAYFVRAGLALRTMDLPAAEAAADRGLATDPHNLELLSIKAAAKFLAEDQAGYEALKQQVLKQNPKFAQFFLIVGEFAEWEHRYDDIVKMMREAEQVDADDGKIYAALGLNLIRNGDDTQGIQQLDKAWSRDEYNVRVYNTRDLFKDIIPKQYVTADGTTFRIRYPREEQALLERYVPRMLEEAWASMVKRYGFTPKTPVGIELYNDGQHFAVRTSGLPNIGIQGVCFGKTLAALSPVAAGFNWGMVVWHELAHVFHIQQSHNRVPRWFTEGLAEYETIIRRPEWRREEDVALYHGLRAGKIPKVASFNRAFTHAEDPGDITMAYFAASQIAVFLAERFGFDKVVAELPKWAAGKQTPEVVQEALGISADELDRQFRAWLDPRLKRYREQFMPDLRPPKSVAEARQDVSAHPKDASRYVKLALGLLKDGKQAEALSNLQLALGLDPKQPDALYLKLRLALGQKKLDDAQKIVEQLIKDGNDGYAVRMKAADIAELQKKQDEMQKHLAAAHKLDPSQAEPLQALYDLAKQADDKGQQLMHLRQLAKLDQHDRRVWRRMLELLVEQGQWKEAVAVGESALYVDVSTPETHRLYARALARTGKQLSAIYELNSAIIAQPEPGEAAAIYRMMAEGYRKLKKPDYAKTAETFAQQMTEQAAHAKKPELKPTGH